MTRLGRCGTGRRHTVKKAEKVAASLRPVAVLSKVTSRRGDLKWATYSKWKGAYDDECKLCFVLEDIGHFGYADDGWFCLPKWVGLEVEKKQWSTMGQDPEQVRIRTTLREVSVRLFPEKCASFWERRVPSSFDKVIEIPLNSRDWAKLRSDEEWQAALKQATPPDSLRDHFKELFLIVKKMRNWLSTTAAEQDSMPGAPSQDHDHDL